MGFKSADANYYFSDNTCLGDALVEACSDNLNAALETIKLLVFWGTKDNPYWNTRLTTDQGAYVRY